MPGTSEHPLFHAIADRVRPRRRLWPILGLLALLAGAGALAQVATKTAAQYCYNGATQQCFDTLDKAEQAMRTASENAGVATLLEQFDPYLLSVPTNGSARYDYGVKDQPGALYTTTYLTGVSDGNLVSGGQGCTTGSDPNRPNWCASEAELVSKTVDKYRQLYPDCTFASAVLADDFGVSPYKTVDGQTVVNTSGYGIVDYGDHRYSTQRTCNGTSDVFRFRIRREATFDCPAAYTRLTDFTPNDGNDDLTLPVLCRYDGGTRTITGPVKQVASCPVSPYPCYPATGDKARREPDFTFAGRTFTRTYHAYHAFRNNPGSGIGWSHTFDDRISGVSTSSGPSGLVDDTGV